MTQNTQKLEIRVDIRIKDITKFNQLVREEYAKMTQNMPFSQFPLGVSLEYILNTYPELWTIEDIHDYQVCNRSPLKYRQKATESIAHWPGWNEGVRA